MTTNPYAAPKAAVADETVVLSADFVPGGRVVPTGNGWSWITAAWGLFKLQPWLWIGMWLLLFVIFMGAAFVPILGSLLTVVFWPVFLAGIAIGCRALDEGGELELAHLFAGFRERLGTLIGVGALYLAGMALIGVIVALVVGTSVFTAEAATEENAAALLLAVLVMTALMLPVIMAIWFAPLLVVFNDLGAVESMKQSFTGCLKNVVPFLIYGLAAMVLAIIASIPLLLGWLVLSPVILASDYTAYRDIYFKPR